MQRELEALLHSEDISLLRSFAMGLASALLSTGGTASREAVGALQPFLHDRAEHFWHELRCSSAAACTLHLESWRQWNSCSSQQILRVTPPS